MRNFIRSQSSILLDVVIQKYSTFNQIQGRYATQRNIVATTNTTSEFRARFYTTANKRELSERQRAGKQAGKRICRTAVAKPELQRSFTKITGGSDSKAGCESSTLGQGQQV